MIADQLGNAAVFFHGDPEAGNTCHECAMAAGGVYPPGQLSTCHYGRCPICLRENQSLTELRDYGHPKISAEFVAVRRTECGTEVTD